MKSAEFNGKRVCAQAVIGSLFKADSEINAIGCYSVHRGKHRLMTSKDAKLVMGQNRLFDVRFGSYDTYNFAALHSGSEMIRCGVSENLCESDHRSFVKALTSVFEKKTLNKVEVLFDAYFDNTIYTLTSLMRDERRRILKLILKESLDDAETTFHRLYAETAPVIPHIADFEVPLRSLILNTQVWVINTDLQRALKHETLETDHIRALLREAATRRVPLDTLTLEHTFRCRLEQMTKQLMVTPQNRGLVQNLQRALALIDDLPFPMDLWKVQKNCFQMADSTYDVLLERAKGGDPRASKWVSHFRNIADMLSIFVRPD